MLFTWACPSGQHCCSGSQTICCGRSKCVGSHWGSASDALPIAATLSLAGRLAPILIQYPKRQRQSRSETNLQTDCGVLSRCHLVLLSHKQPLHTAAAGAKLSDKQKDMQTK